MKKKNKKSFSYNRLLRGGIVLSLILIMGTLFGGISLAKMNLEVQKLESEVKNQSDTNQSLIMKINEMASLDNIKNISDQNGLAYNNDNIKTITDG